MPSVPGIDPSLLASLKLPGSEPFGGEGDEPVYSLPVEVIDVLKGPRRDRRQHWLNKDQVAAERDYTRHCESMHCVGFQEQGPIDYHLLTRKLIDTSDPYLKSMGWTASQLRSIQRYENEASSVTDRLRGVVGWLLTEPAFVKEVNGVRDMYRRIPRDSRPRFPLARILCAPGSFSDTESRFGNALVAFLDRWGVMSLAAWELPAPQGPLLPDHMPPGIAARPVHGIHIYVPMHYPLKGDDDLQARIEKFQEQTALELGIDSSLAGLGHFETYERMFRILHIERAIRRRFPESPRGLVESIENAAAAECNLSRDRVQRLRKYIAQCLQGKRRQIKALRVKR